MLRTLSLGPLCANCYILTDDKGHGVVIDPGASAWKIIPEVEGVKIDYIIITHSHFDHFTAAVPLKKATGALIAMSETDAEDIKDPNKSLLCWFQGMNAEIPEADVRLRDGDVLTAGALQLEIIATSGHSKGCICIRCGNMLFTGDTLFRRSVGRTDLPGGDPDELINSVKTKLFTIGEDLAVYPGHDVPTSLFEEMRENPWFGGGAR